MDTGVHCVDFESTMGVARGKHPERTWKYSMRRNLLETDEKFKKFMENALISRKVDTTK